MDPATGGEFTVATLPWQRITAIKVVGRLLKMNVRVVTVDGSAADNSVRLLKLEKDPRTAGGATLLLKAVRSPEAEGMLQRLLQTWSVVVASGSGRATSEADPFAHCGVPAEAVPAAERTAASLLPSVDRGSAEDLEWQLAAAAEAERVASEAASSTAAAARAARLEAERVAAEVVTRAEAERQTAARLEAERVAAEAVATAEAERRAVADEAATAQAAAATRSEAERATAAQAALSPLLSPRRPLPSLPVQQLGRAPHDPPAAEATTRSEQAELAAAAPASSGEAQRDEAGRRESLAAARHAEDRALSLAEGAQGAVLAAGAAAAALCVPLARAAAVLLAEAVEAFKRSVANREKGRCLLERMQLLAPVLAQIAEHHDSGRLSGAAADGAAEILVRINGNFADAARLLGVWATKGKGFFGALRQALESDAFSRDFDRLRDELAARVAELQLYQLVAARVAGDVSAWAAADAAADVADRRELPACVVGLVDDEAGLSEALAEAGMEEGRFKELLTRHGVSFDEVLASLDRMQSAIAKHNEKLDQTIALLQRGQLKQRPADLLDWADLAVDTEEPVGVGAFGNVYQARWRGSTVAVKVVAEGAVLDGRTINKIYREANLMASILNHPNVVRSSRSLCFWRFCPRCASAMAAFSVASGALLWRGAAEAPLRAGARVLRPAAAVGGRALHPLPRAAAGGAARGAGLGGAPAPGGGRGGGHGAPALRAHRAYPAAGGARGPEGGQRAAGARRTFRRGSVHPQDRGLWPEPHPRRGVLAVQVARLAVRRGVQRHAGLHGAGAADRRPAD